MSWSEEHRQTLEGGSTHRLNFCQSKFLGVWLHQGDGSSGMLQRPGGLPSTQACKSLSGPKEEGIWNWEWARQDFALFKAAQGTILAKSKHIHSRTDSTLLLTGTAACFASSSAQGHWQKQAILNGLFTSVSSNFFMSGHCTALTSLH